MFESAEVVKPLPLNAHFDNFLQTKWNQVAGLHALGIENELNTLQQKTALTAIERSDHARSLFQHTVTKDISGKEEKIQERLNALAVESALRLTTNDRKNLITNVIQIAFEERKTAGFEEPRSQDWSRGLMGEFLLYLKSQGIKQINIFAGDMNYLKPYNLLADKLGDASLLTLFFAARKLAEETNGVLFIPNIGGGDDFLIMTLDSNDKLLSNDHFAELVQSEVKSIEDLKKHTIFGRPLAFHSSGETKFLDEKEIAQISARMEELNSHIGEEDRKITLEKIFPPSAECLLQTISLSEALTEDLHATDAVKPFFDIVLKRINRQISEHKKRKGINRNLGQPDKTS